MCDADRRSEKMGSRLGYIRTEIRENLGPNLDGSLKLGLLKQVSIFLS